MHYWFFGNTTDPNLSEQDQAVLDALKKKSLYPALYYNVPYQSLPRLLQDKTLGNIQEVVSKSGKKTLIYGNLMDSYSLLNYVKEGKVELYITETVMGELLYLKENVEEVWPVFEDFISKYATYVEIPEEYEEEFFTNREKLVQEYVGAKVMEQRYSASHRKMAPENDAYIVAEASLLGLHVITANRKHFVDMKGKGNFLRTNAIEQINKDFGLKFESNVPNWITTPVPKLLGQTTAALKKADVNLRPVWIVNPNIEDGKYVKQEEGIST